MDVAKPVQMADGSVDVGALSLPRIVPFELLNGHITLRARVGGQAARLILDTGSSVSSLDLGWAERMELTPVGQPVRAAGTGDLEVRLVSLRSIEVGGIELTDLTVALLPLSAVGRAHGAEIDGVLGFEFLSRFAVEIDYGGRVLRVHDSRSFSYGGPGAVLPVSLAYRVPVVAARVVPAGGRPTDVRLILDLGSSGLAVRLAPGVIDLAELADLTGHDAPLGTGVGGPLPGRIVRLEQLSLGPLLVARPTAGIALEKQGALGMAAFDGTVGTPVFERTTMILDYSRERVIFEPGARWGEPYAWDASGLTLRMHEEEEHRVVVGHVIAGSPAEEAGLAVGDEIVALDGCAVGELGLPTIRELLRQDGGLVQVSVLRAGQGRQAQLRLRSLV